MSGEPDWPGGLFNPQEALRELAGDIFPVHTRKLSFSEQCGLAYALRTVSHETVRSAFGLSRATVSHLAQALKPGRAAYANVWREWSNMSEDAFIAKHYTRELHFRLKRVQLGLSHLPGGELDYPARNPRIGADNRADKYSYYRYGVIELDDNSRWRIDWGPMRPSDLTIGWWFAHAGPDDERGTCLPVGDFYGSERVLGLIDKKPFRTSADAFDAIYEINGYASPRAKPGRPQK